MTAVARACIGFGAACFCAAFATVLMTMDLGWAEGAAEFWQLAQRGLVEDRAWRWTCWALGGSLSLALALGGVARWLERPRGIGRSIHAPPRDHRNRVQWIAEVGRRITRNLSESDPSVVNAFEEIVRGALEVGASDIHFSPTPDTFRITYRVVGTLYEAVALDRRWAQPFSTRIKVLSGLETHVRQRPQDGRLTMQLDA